MESVETKPRTGIVGSVREVTVDDADKVAYIRNRMHYKVGAAICEKIEDGRAYAVTLAWHDEWTGGFEFYPKVLRLQLHVTILLRHWQDAQVGEDVVPDAFASKDDDILEFYATPERMRRIYGDTPPKMVNETDLDTWRFQRITTNGKTVAWRRVA
jgi:hypothetical protein